MRNNSKSIPRPIWKKMGPKKSFWQRFFLALFGGLAGLLGTSAGQKKASAQFGMSISNRVQVLGTEQSASTTTKQIDSIQQNFQLEKGVAKQLSLENTDFVSNNTSSSTLTGSYVNINGAYFQDTTNGLVAVSDPVVLRKLQSGEIQSTSQKGLGATQVYWPVSVDGVKDSINSNDAVQQISETTATRASDIAQQFNVIVAKEAAKGNVNSAVSGATYAVAAAVVANVSALKSDAAQAATQSASNALKVLDSLDQVKVATALAQAAVVLDSVGDGGGADSSDGSVSSSGNSASIQGGAGVGSIPGGSYTAGITIGGVNIGGNLGVLGDSFGPVTSAVANAVGIPAAVVSVVLSGLGLAPIVGPFASALSIGDAIALAPKNAETARIANEGLVNIETALNFALTNPTVFASLNSSLAGLVSDGTISPSQAQGFQASLNSGTFNADTAAAITAAINAEGSNLGSSIGVVSNTGVTGTGSSASSLGSSVVGYGVSQIASSGRVLAEPSIPTSNATNSVTANQTSPAVVAAAEVGIFSQDVIGLANTTDINLASAINAAANNNIHVAAVEAGATLAKTQKVATKLEFAIDSAKNTVQAVADAKTLDNALTSKSLVAITTMQNVLLAVINDATKTLAIVNNTVEAYSNAVGSSNISANNAINIATAANAAAHSASDVASKLKTLSAKLADSIAGKNATAIAIEGTQLYDLSMKLSVDPISITNPTNQSGLNVTAVDTIGTTGTGSTNTTATPDTTGQSSSGQSGSFTSATGVIGFSGTSGTEGTSSASGSEGITSAPSSSGQTGIAGNDGTSGQTGTTSGTGTNGTSGVTGSSGATGTTGSGSSTGTDGVSSVSGSGTGTGASTGNSSGVGIGTSGTSGTNTGVTGNTDSNTPPTSLSFTATFSPKTGETTITSEVNTPPTVSGINGEENDSGPQGPATDSDEDNVTPEEAALEAARSEAALAAALAKNSNTSFSMGGVVSADANSPTGYSTGPTFTGNTATNSVTDSEGNIIGTLSGPMSITTGYSGLGLATADGTGVTARGNSDAQGANTFTCFIADTLVLMSGGTHKTINKIILGDLLQGWDWDTKSQVVTPVTQISQAIPTDEIYQINGIRVTRMHRFAVGHYIWKRAYELKVGDTTLGPDGKITTILNTSRLDISEPVFNLRVGRLERTANFYVGDKDNFYLVHNDGDSSGGSGGSDGDGSDGSDSTGDPGDPGPATGDPNDPGDPGPAPAPAPATSNPGDDPTDTSDPGLNPGQMGNTPSTARK